MPNKWRGHYSMIWRAPARRYSNALRTRPCHLPRCGRRSRATAHARRIVDYHHDRNGGLPETRWHAEGDARPIRNRRAHHDRHADVSARMALQTEVSLRLKRRGGHRVPPASSFRGRTAEVVIVLYFGPPVFSGSTSGGTPLDPRDAARHPAPPRRARPNPPNSMEGNGAQVFPSSAENTRRR